MSIFKRITAGLTALSLAAVCTGCKSMTVAMTIGDYTVPAGVYIYYLSSSYSQALSELTEDYPDLDTTDIKAVKECVLEGQDVRTWVENKALEFCLDFVATEQKFDELQLTLDEETVSNIDMMTDYYWASYEEDMTANGVSQESFKKVMTSSYKSQEIFDYYYGVDGAEGVTEDELKEHYIENNIRAQYIAFDLHDSEGEALDDAGKSEIKKLAQEYQKRIEQAYQTGGAEAVMTEMDAVQEEYAAYQEAKSAEEEDADAVVDEGADAVIDEDADAGADEDADAGIEEESIAEETVASFNAPKILTLEEVAAPEEDVNAETAVAADEDAETPAEIPEILDGVGIPDEDADISNEENPDIVTYDIGGEVETTPIQPRTIDGIEEEADGESTDDGIALINETGEEIAVDDAAVETEEETVPPYQNERIIKVINPEDYEDEEDIYYTPDETVYNQLVGIQAADYGKVCFVEEEETYYLVVRYDITERMTEEDLWTESAIENAAYDKYYDAFEDLLDTWSAALSVTKNDAAIKRYDPYEYNF